MEKSSISQDYGGVMLAETLYTHTDRTVPRERFLGDSFLSKLAVFLDRSQAQLRALLALAVQCVRSSRSEPRRLVTTYRFADRLQYRRGTLLCSQPNIFISMT